MVMLGKVVHVFPHLSRHRNLTSNSKRERGRKRETLFAYVAEVEKRERGREGGERRLVFIAAVSADSPN